MQCCKEFYRILPTIFCHITLKQCSSKHVSIFAHKIFEATGALKNAVQKKDNAIIIKPYNFITK